MCAVEVFSDIFNDPEKEVTTHEIWIDKNRTIYHPKGLFSEQIFGPVKDYSCQCGAVRGKKYKGTVCKKCGVVCDLSSLRYTQFGYIKVKVPILFTPIMGKVIARFFAMKPHYERLTTLIAFSREIFVFDKTIGKIVELPHEILSFIHEKFGDNIVHVDLTVKEFWDVIFYELSLKGNVDIEEFKRKYEYMYPIFGIYSLYRLYKKCESFKEKVEEFFKNNPKYEYFRDVVFIDKIPVIPPDLRPVITINNRIIIHDITKTLISILNKNNHPLYQNITFDEDAIGENEKIKDIYEKDLYAIRIQVSANRYFNLIESRLGGKTGDVRQYLHGKVIDFSLRGVIVPSLRIKPYEIEIPYKAAREILSLHFISYFLKKFSKDPKYSSLTFKLLALQHGIMSENHLSNKEREILDGMFKEFVEKVNSGEIKFYAVFNRVPTLWIYNFIVFDVKVKLDERDDTIGIHPLACEQQNADADGDSILGDIHLQIKYDDGRIVDDVIHISKLEDYEV